MSTVPKVSVWMVTYNHQDYIAQAVESVMMQQTDFNVHLFIGEDFSSDNTRDICQFLKQKYPDRISLLLNEKKLGANKNAGNIYKACFDSSAKYIAMLEGDDYWTDPLKIQKQVDFMEQHPEYTGCFHNTDVINEMVLNPQSKPWRTYTKNNFILKDTLSKTSLFHTSSFLFRSVVLKIPVWFKEVQSGDMALFTIIASQGPLYRIDECMSVYRKNETGITNSIKHLEYYTNRIKLFEYFKVFLEGRETEQIKVVSNYYKGQLKKLKKTLLKNKLKQIFKI